MAKETKELAVKEETAIAVADLTADELKALQEDMQDMGLDSSDMLIPRISLMQGLSEAVAEGNATIGDIINSLTGVKLGDKNNAVEFIPLTVYKTWVRRKLVGAKYEYDSTLPFTAANANLPWEEEVGGTKYRNDKTLNVYVLLAKDIAEGRPFPAVVSFSRTSSRAGKAIATHFMQSISFKQHPSSSVLKLCCHMEKNDLGNYYVFDVLPGRRATSFEYAATIDITDKIKRSNVVVQEEQAERAPSGTRNVEVADGDVC